MHLYTTALIHCLTNTSSLVVYLVLLASYSLVVNSFHLPAACNFWKNYILYCSTLDYNISGLSFVAKANANAKSILDSII